MLAFSCLSWPSYTGDYVGKFHWQKVYGVHSPSLVATIVTLIFFLYLYASTFCREPRGFGFVQYSDPHDAAEAKHHMDGRVLLGRELTVVFAEENRKKPGDMRARERTR